MLFIKLKGARASYESSIQMNNHMGRLDEHVAVGTNYV